MFTSLIAFGLLAQVAPSPTPDPATAPTLNLASHTSYGNTQLNWDATASKWVGCLTRPFRYTDPRLICGTASGTAVIHVEMDRNATVTLRWNAAGWGVCAVDATCSSPSAYANRRSYSTVQGPKWTATGTYNPAGEALPPIFGYATVVITTP